MKLTTQETPSLPALAQEQEPPKRAQRLRSWLFSWEIYLLLAVASFLRLYGIQRTEFDADQADIFRMAHDALSHGHLVATSNIASIGIYNPPGIIYALMLSALFSPNPLWGAVETALQGILAVLLTYWFTRRYYGRFAATIASFIYAVAGIPIAYARFMWNQNLLLFFVPLFMVVIFRGAVDRRRGWLAFALPLYGLLFQWHGSGLLLAAPLVLAVLLAPRTIRIRDILIGVVGVLFIYSPYIFWLAKTRFQDISILLSSSQKKPMIDSQAWLFYQHFLRPYPYEQQLNNVASPLYRYVMFFGWVLPILLALVIAGIVLALVLALRPGSPRSATDTDRKQSPWQLLWRWWLDLSSSPERCGLLLLVVWQVVPLLYLSRHTFPMQAHYLIIFLPGQFMLVGFFLSRLTGWLRHVGGWANVGRYVVYYLAILLVLFHFLASTASVLDMARGIEYDGRGITYFNDLSALQRALGRADTIAQQRHLKRVFVLTDFATRNSLRYLSQNMRTPSVTADDGCLPMPGPETGPAVLLTPPYNGDLFGLLSSNYIKATLLEKPEHPGGEPFRIYLLNPLSTPTAEAKGTGDVQFLDWYPLSINDQPRLLTRWRFLRPLDPAYRTTRAYNVQMSPSVDPQNAPKWTCNATAWYAGDQVVIPFHSRNDLPASITLKATTTSSEPYLLSTRMFGLLPQPLVFDSFKQVDAPERPLSLADGKPDVTVSLVRP